MTTLLNTRDLVQGLEDYTHDIKPYHTKILEVWIEYIYNDLLDVAVNDATHLQVGVSFDRSSFSSEYGFALVPWNLMIDGSAPGDVDANTLPYGTTTIQRSALYRLYHQYVRESNKTNKPDFVPKQPIAGVVDPVFLPLTDVSLWNEAKSFFARAFMQTPYWFDACTKTLYERTAPGWVERSCFYGPFPPQNSSVYDLWVTVENRLFVKDVNGEWTRYFDLAVTNSITPNFPMRWMSNWDLHDDWRVGENVISVSITEEFSTRYFNKLDDKVRTAVYDPTSNRAENYDQTTMLRADYPIEVTTISSYNNTTKAIEYRDIEESIVTNPSISGQRMIALDGSDLLGFNVLREYKGPRISDYKVWTTTSTGATMSYVSPINQKTFRFGVAGSALIAYSVAGNTLTEIDCPFNDGDVVYFEGTDDLPSYYLPSQDPLRTRPNNQEFLAPQYTQFDADGTIVIQGTRSLDSTQALKLQRYAPYRIVKLTGRTFSVVMLNEDLSVAKEMGSDPYINMIDAGTGMMFVGYGEPVAFIRTEEPSTPPPGTPIGTTISEVVTIRYV